MNFRRLLGLTIGLLSLGAAATAYAAPITYDVSEAVGTATITGTITTDGAIGSISVANIVDWNLLLTDGVLSSTLDSSSSFLGGTEPLFATATTLSYDHSATVADDYVLFFANDNVAYWCLQGSSGLCSGYTLSSDIAINDGFGARVTYADPQSGVNLIGAVVPEPNTALLLATGLLALAARGRRKRA